MAYEPPTVEDFKRRFRTFGPLGSDNDEAVFEALYRAASVADHTWADADRVEAVMLAAGHELTLAGHGGGAESELARAGALGFRSFRSGALSLERFDQPSGAGQANGYGQTAYGRQLQALIRSRFVGVMVV